SSLPMRVKSESSQKSVHTTLDGTKSPLEISHASQNTDTREESRSMQVPYNLVCCNETSQNALQNGNASQEEPIDSDSVKGIFGWETVDDTNIPCILRQQKKFVSVRIVERKLLSKYPNTFPDELGKKDPLVSYFITESEANLLNEINTTHCDFEYGHNPFTVKDLIVDLEEFVEFFNIVKKTFPEDFLSKIGGEPAAPGVSAPVKTDLSQFCGWIQINNTVSPYIVRIDNGRQVKLVPLSVIMYAAGLLTNSNIHGLLPTPQECAMLNETCKVAGFDFMFGKSTRLISVSEVLHRCQVQIFELPFKNPLQHARYLDPCTGQYSSIPLMGLMPAPLSTTESVQQQPSPLSKPLQSVLDHISVNTGDLNPYISGLAHPAFHPSQMTMSGGLSGISSGITGLWEPPSPTRMRLQGPYAGLNMDAFRFQNPHRQAVAEKSLDGSVKQGFPGSLWIRAPPPAHINSVLNSMMSKTPPVTPDPPHSSAFQSHSLPSNPMLYCKNTSAQLNMTHSHFRSPIYSPHRPPVSQVASKDLPASAVKYPSPLNRLPLTPSQYLNSLSFPFGVNQFDSSYAARNESSIQKTIADAYQMSAKTTTHLPASGESLTHFRGCSSDNKHPETSHLEPEANFLQQNISADNPTAASGNTCSVTDLSQNISACLINGKSISCINVNLPHRKGSFCLVEAVSKLYFPSVPLTEFVKVLQVVLKVSLHECTSQEEAAFVQYYNLPVKKLKCNKIIRVDDLEAYFPQLNYMFSKRSSDAAADQPSLNQQSPACVGAQKRRKSSPTPGPASKVALPKLESVVRKLHQEKNTAPNEETQENSDKNSVIIIDDE
ncbi:unnamed protein product, partial [Candidula unifasciata]